MNIVTLTTADLKASTLNMRKLSKKADLSDILPSIREKGILQNLIVRKNGVGYNVVAGGRRFAAALVVAEETGAPVEVPCSLVEGDDDAEALELSMIENLARINPNPVEQYKAFDGLNKQGRSVEEISILFGVSVRVVNQRLALGNLQPAVLKLFLAEEIDAEEMQLLTLANAKKQKEYVRLFNSETERCPSEWQLKNWIFEDGEINADYAIFDMALYTGPIVTDLFEDEKILTDTKLFWDLQNTEIAARKDKYLKAKWADVEIVDGSFDTWKYTETSKKLGGKVFVQVRRTGETIFHEGFLPDTEIRKQMTVENGETAPVSISKPEISNPTQEYVALHRHAAVRRAVSKDPKIGHRLMVALFLTSQHPHYAVASKQEINVSVEASTSVKEFDAETAIALERLGLSCSSTKGHFLSTYHDTLELFQKLMQMTDLEVMEVCAFAAAETLENGTTEVDVLGQLLDVDMSKVWEPDETFLGLILNKTTLNALLASVGGKKLADANISQTGKVMRRILNDLFRGENGREKVTGWIPEWMKFPFSFHTKKEGLSELNDKKKMKSIIDTLKPVSK